MLNDDLISPSAFATPEEPDSSRPWQSRENEVLREYLDGAHNPGRLSTEFSITMARCRRYEFSMDSMRSWIRQNGRVFCDKDVYRFSKGDVVETYAGVARRILSLPQSDRR